MERGVAAEAVTIKAPPPPCHQSDTQPDNPEQHPASDRNQFSLSIPRTHMSRGQANKLDRPITRVKALCAPARTFPMPLSVECI